MDDGSEHPQRRYSVIALTTGSIVMMGLLAAFGSLFIYLPALLVVKVGIPAPRLVFGVPLAFLALLCWRANRERPKRETVATLVVAAVTAIVLFAAWRPPLPTLQLTTIPSFALVLGYATVFVCVAITASTLIRAGLALRKRRAATYDL